MWISSKEFALQYGLVRNSLQKACLRATLRGRKICILKFQILCFRYINGVAGNSGKFLQIWSEPFASEEEAECFIISMLQEERKRARSVAKSFCAVDISPMAKYDKINSQHGNVESFCYAQHDKVEAQSNKVDLECNNNEILCYARKDNGKGQHDKVADNNAIVKSFLGNAPHNNKAKMPVNYNRNNKQGLIESSNRGNIYNCGDSMSSYDKSSYESSATPTYTISEYTRANLKQRESALIKQSIIKEWIRAKDRGINAKDFIKLLNIQGKYPIVLSLNKLFAWQRAYKQRGLDGLVDTRGYKKQGFNKIKQLGLEELVNKLILGSKGRVNVSAIHNLLHMHLDIQGKIHYREFLNKDTEVVSYSVIDRYVKEYLKSNPLIRKLIAKGEDASMSSYMPSLGRSN